MSSIDSLSATIEEICLSHKQDHEFKRALEELIRNAASDNYLDEDIASLITRINRRQS